MSTDTTLAEAMAEVGRREDAVHAARGDLRAAVQAALAGGVPAAHVAEVLGVSRGRVYQIRDGVR